MKNYKTFNDYLAAVRLDISTMISNDTNRLFLSYLTSRYRHLIPSLLPARWIAIYRYIECMQYTCYSKIIKSTNENSD